MFDKTAHRPNSLPGGEHKRFEKTRSRMVYHAIMGAWGPPQQASDGSYWPSGHCLLLLSERSDNE